MKEYTVQIWYTGYTERVVKATNDSTALKKAIAEDKKLLLGAVVDIEDSKVILHVPRIAGKGDYY